MVNDVYNIDTMIRKLLYHKYWKYFLSTTSVASLCMSHVNGHLAVRVLLEFVNYWNKKGKLSSIVSPYNCFDSSLSPILKIEAVNTDSIQCFERDCHRITPLGLYWDKKCRYYIKLYQENKQNCIDTLSSVPFCFLELLSRVLPHLLS